MTMVLVVAVAHSQTNSPTGDTRTSTSTASKTILLTTQYRDWDYRCVAPAPPKGKKLRLKNAKKLSCELLHSVKTTVDDTAVQLMSVAFTRAGNANEQDKWVLVLITSLALDVHLPSQFGLQIGEHEPLISNFRSCNFSGCLVVVPADNSLLNSMKKAKSGIGLFKLLSGKIVKLDISLKGFTKAFNALKAGKLPKKK